VKSIKHSTALILDLDGVLITTPSWKADEMDSDGYSKFNRNCVANLNELLSKFDFEIWLSSSRRTNKTLSDFNQIFKHRKIQQSISGYLPAYSNCTSRKEEILKFIEEFKFNNFLIIDDDKSLNGLDKSVKQKLILTEMHKGFNIEQLNLAIEKNEQKLLMISPCTHLLKSLKIHYISHRKPKNPSKQKT
jgi:hypothetical protein